MRESERTEEILRFARDIRASWGNDPIKIAEICGINVFESEYGKTSDSSTICLDGYPTIISLYGCRNQTIRRVLCAHELGYALLHDNMTVNRFNGTIKGIQNRCEYEANLFAVALLFDEDDLNEPLCKMDNWTLKILLDYNLEK